MSILIRSARVLTMDDDDTEIPRTDILVQGSRIAAIGPDLDVSNEGEEVRVIPAENLLAMPGLVNGHFHSPGNFLKGATDDAPLEIFMLYEVPPFSDEPPSPHLNHVRTMLGAVEMLKLGVTSVHDDAFYNPRATEEAIDGLMRAYETSGMRAVVTIDQPNVVEYEKYPFLFDLLPEDIRRRMAETPRQSTEELTGLYTWFIERWNGACDGRLGTAVSCSAPQRVTPEYLQILSELSERHRIPYDIHILETKLQRVLGEEKHGKSLVRYVHDAGVLTPRMMVIHAIWVDNEDIELLAASGCTVAHNPISNQKIGSGIMPFRRLRSAGVPICLGTDEASVDDTANMWGAAKAAGLIHKVADPEYRNWPTAPELLRCLTRGGARGMGLENRVGVLAAGYEADIILVDLNTLAFTPLNDLRRQLVFSENGSSVVMTMVAGRIVCENGRVLTVDEEALKEEVRALFPEHRRELAQTAAAAAELNPYYREMYLRAAAREVGMHRWAGPMTP